MPTSFKRCKALNFTDNLPTRKVCIFNGSFLTSLDQIEKNRDKKISSPFSSRWTLKALINGIFAVEKKWCPLASPFMTKRFDNASRLLCNLLLLLCMLATCFKIHFQSCFLVLCSLQPPPVDF